MSPILSGSPLSTRRGTLGDPPSLWLSALLNASEDAIFFTSLDGLILRWNPAAERLFGYTAEEILGKPDTILSPPNCLHEAIAILDPPVDDIPTNAFQWIRLHQDGTRFHASIRITPVVEEGGRAIGWVTIAWDSTARKREEEQASLLSTAAAFIHAG